MGQGQLTISERASSSAQVGEVRSKGFIRVEAVEFTKLVQI